MVLNELESGAAHHSLILSEEVRKRDRELLSVVKGEYEDIVKNEVQRAISPTRTPSPSSAGTTSTTSGVHATGEGGATVHRPVRGAG